MLVFSYMHVQLRAVGEHEKAAGIEALLARAPEIKLPKPQPTPPEPEVKAHQTSPGEKTSETKLEKVEKARALIVQVLTRSPS